MARLAYRAFVHAGQWEGGLVVIESCWSPGCSAMTLGAESAH